MYVMRRCSVGMPVFDAFLCAMHSDVYVMYAFYVCMAFLCAMSVCMFVTHACTHACAWCVCVHVCVQCMYVMHACIYALNVRMHVCVA